MRIMEFRILMPLTVEEYRIGQLYSTTELSRLETGGGDGVEVIVDEPFEIGTVSAFKNSRKQNQPLFHGRYTMGQYTFKKYHMKNKVNAFVRKLAPKGMLEFEEYSWNAYPYCRTIIRNESYMKDDFEVKVETFHTQDRGTQNNVHLLSENELKERKIDYIDIASSKFSVKADEKDLTTFKSKETGRGPLKENWEEDRKLPIMCCYKLVTVNFKWFGLQRTVEKMILKNQKKLFARFNRLVFGWIDSWIHLSVDQIREMDTKAKEELDKQREEAEAKGTAME